MWFPVWSLWNERRSSEATVYWTRKFVLSPWLPPQHQLDFPRPHCWRRLHCKLPTAYNTHQHTCNDPLLVLFHTPGQAGLPKQWTLGFLTCQMHQATGEIIINNEIDSLHLYTTASLPQAISSLVAARSTSRDSSRWVHSKKTLTLGRDLIKILQSVSAAYHSCFNTTTTIKIWHLSAVFELSLMVNDHFPMLASGPSVWNSFNWLFTRHLLSHSVSQSTLNSHLYADY